MFFKQPLRIYQVRNQQGVFEEKKAKILLKLFLGLTVHFLVNKLFKKLYIEGATAENAKNSNHPGLFLLILQDFFCLKSLFLCKYT